jgi:MoaA/NifB/PqqE/SkfB family radical SAM enzyme
MTDKIKKIINIIEEKTGSKTFCVLPWIHLATRPNGDARLCCGSNASGAHLGDNTLGLVKMENGEPANFARETPLEAFNNTFMKDVRKTMREGNIPSSCFKCFEEEQNGVISKRVWEAYDWHLNGIDFTKLLEDTEEDGTVPPVIPYIDLRLGHTCNLKCVMCSPHDSSRWVSDYEKLMKKTQNVSVIRQMTWDKQTFNNYWYEKPEFWDDIFEQIPHVKQLYFAGGEPLMIKEHKAYLLEIIKRGYAKDIALRYNSNGIYVNQEIIDIWKQFKSVRYAFSIDAYGDKNNYIRYPTEWSDIERALDLLDNTPDNINVSIAFAIQLLNVKHLIDFAKWKIQKNYKKINKYSVFDLEVGGGIISMHMLYIPTYLSARLLPKEDKEQLTKDFSDFKQWLWDNYRQDDDFWIHNPYGWKRWEGILKFINAEDHTSQLPDFKEFINNLDNIRGLDCSSIFPELKHIL